MPQGLIGVKLAGTTDSSGDLTVNAANAVNGLLYAVEWVVGTFAAINRVCGILGHKSKKLELVAELQIFISSADPCKAVLGARTGFLRRYLGLR